MAAKFFSSTIVLIVIFLSFTESANVNTVGGTCPNGLCSEVNTTIRDALTSCNLLKKNHGFDLLDPAKLESFVFQNVSKSGIPIIANFTNMTLTGISTLKIQTLASDTSKLKLQFKLNFTEWNVTGSYNLTGRPIHGNGTFSIVASEVRLSGNSSLKVRSNGALYVDDLRLTLEFGKAKVRFHKLDKGSTTTEASDRLIIALAKKVLGQTSPKLLQKLKTALESCLNNKLENVNIFKG